MKYLTLLYFTVLIIGSGYSQTGSTGDPFTSLNQAAAVSSAGIYYFNLGGTAFNTHVDANGYVQVAIDFGNGSGNLPQITSLTTSSRGILNTSILATLTETVEVRLSSSTGNNDVTTTNSTLINRVQSNTTLHQGIADNTINNGWTGSNASRFNDNASGTTNLGTSLHQNIFHPSGNQSSFHWIPSGSYQRETWSDGEVAGTASFHLWVKGNAAILPIELIDFSIIHLGNNLVKLNWQTASEINNDYFAIERSTNGFDWEEVRRIDGAGSSASVLSYSTIDKNPNYGTSFYRLKQMSFDGQFEYSQIRSVSIQQLVNSQIEVYPNPAVDQIVIKGSSKELEKFALYNAFGQNVTSLTSQILTNETQMIIDISKLNTGMYLLKLSTTAKKVYKQ